MNPQPPPRATPPERSLGLALGLLIFACACLHVAGQYTPSTWLARDARFYVNVNETLSQDGTLDQHRFAASWYNGRLGWNRNLGPGWSNVSLGARGEYWPKHPWLMPVLATPLYFAFGLPGTLLFNLLGFLALSYGLFRFNHRLAGPHASAAAVILFVLSTALIEASYNYSLDVLNLGCFAMALGCIRSGRHRWAGLLVGLCVMMRATNLLYLPALMLLYVEGKNWRGLRRALGLGTLVLLGYAASNFYLFGRPWLTSYHRILVTVAGEPQALALTDVFNTPFTEGLERIFFGHYALTTHFAVLALALPGCIFLFRKSPYTAWAALWSLGASLTIFSFYPYEGHRFHWPALALLTPALALSLHHIIRAFSSLRLRWQNRPLMQAPWISALAFALGFVCTLRFSPETGLLVLGYRWDLLVLSLFAGAVAAFYFCRFLLHHLPSPLAMGLSVAPLLLPAVRLSIIYSPEGMSAIAAAAIAVDAGLKGRHVRALVAAAGAAFLSQTFFFMLPFALLLSPWTAKHERRTLMWTCVGLGIAFCVLEFSPLRRFALFGAVEMIPPEALYSAWQDVWQEPELRAFGCLAALLPFALAVGFNIARPWGAWLAALGLGACALPLGTPIGMQHLSTPLLLLATGGLMWRAAQHLSHWNTRQTWIRGLVVLTCLGICGISQRIEAASHPFRATAGHSVRHAHVSLDDIPCDFLAWEHASWECSAYDRGLHALSGLASSEPTTLNGQPQRLFHLATGLGQRSRRVRWDEIEAGEELRLWWAVVDGRHGGATLEVRIDGALRAEVEIPRESDGQIHTLSFDTAELAGQRAVLELTLRPNRHVNQASVSFDAHW